MSSPAFQIRSRVPRIAEAAVERARLSVVPRRRVRAARVPFVTLVALVLLGGVVGLLLFNTSMQQASFAATALSDQASSLTAREQTLRMELDVLRDPQRVAEQARRMGMVTGGVPASLDLRSGRVLGGEAGSTPTTNLRIDPLLRVPAILDPAPLRVPAPATADQTSTDSGASATAGTAGDGKNGSHPHQLKQQSLKTRN